MLAINIAEAQPSVWKLERLKGKALLLRFWIHLLANTSDGANMHLSLPRGPTKKGVKTVALASGDTRRCWIHVCVK